MTVMVQTEAVSKHFVLHLRDGLVLPVLRDVALSGPSGAGKSTLLRALYGNYRVQGGRILIRHDNEMVDIAAADPHLVLQVRARSLGYVSQFLRVVPRVAALDIVAQAAPHLPDAQARTRAAEMLLRLNIPRRLHDLPPATFSGGEQQRINLARGFIGGHPILLLDEPTASLDDANRAVVLDMITEAKQRGAALIGIFHDQAVRDAAAERLFPVAPLQDAA